ncbi:hypothetical protein AGABI2DRAFT_136806, partial [Agaricus bisporus var. bisporus H97]|uniref:hypothetical protein n=1 Tax=Agaricus bisporus var. bisporus (strain H97 / ATCC MYA-4626 / FGSC 10389) TaxID=936046 RepID=UPI00029F6618
MGAWNIHPESEGKIREVIDSIFNLGKGISSRMEAHNLRSCVTGRKVRPTRLLWHANRKSCRKQSSGTSSTRRYL